MNGLDDPLVLNGSWICLLAGGVLTALALHDRRFGGTRALLAAGIVLLAVGVVLAVATAVLALQPRPEVY